MKKQNLIIKALGAVLLLTTVFAVTACSSKKTEAGVDTTKSQFYVYSFTSGFGSEWLESLIADYEEANKDVSFEEGKKGIQIWPTCEKRSVQGTDMKNRQEVVYFLEQQDYYSLVSNNYVSDITAAITGTNPYESGLTLEDKLFEAQKDYFGRTVNGETRYYAYPHYFTAYGIAYDIDLFDEKGYYFVDGYQATDALEDKFIGRNTGEEGWEKTAGADGIKGTSDDGLPTTYEEFLWLCDYIYEVGGDNPIIWTGQYRESYLTHLINALATDYEGYDQMYLNFSFDGTATDLGTIQNGEFVLDAEDTVIDGTNGAEMARQAGKYYAMDFYSKLYAKDYVSGSSFKQTLFSSTFSHLQAQEQFLLKGTHRNAMLLDGTWWQEEANDIYNQMAKTNEANSKQNRNIGYMPLPKATSEKVGEKSTMYDIMYPLCVVKSGLDKTSWQYKVAIDFIQFANTNEQIAKFEQITSCPKALNYTLTTEQYNALTKYGQTLYDQYKASDIVFPYNNNLLFANNQNTFNELIISSDGSPLYKSTAYATTFVKAIENGVSAEEYFSGMYTYFSELNIWKSAK